MSYVGWIQRGWVALNRRHWRRFRSALAAPEAAQLAILRRALRDNAQTEIGKRLGFDSIDSPTTFRDRVPRSRYEDYEPLIGRIRRGETCILTRAPVRRLVPSSGSTAASKLIPYTLPFQAEIGRAVGPWIVDLHRRHPTLAAGPAYWSISPAVHVNADGSSIPVGFDRDSSYLGGVVGSLVERTLAVPSSVARIPNIGDFLFATSSFLLRARELRLISVWHPSFFAVLLETIEERWDALLEEIAKSVPRRAKELSQAGPREPGRLWPRLAVISWWADAHAAPTAAELAPRFPGVTLQAKGLVATEAFVSVPFESRRPLAINSHFFEFLDSHGRAHLAHELRDGAEYEVLVTTGAGLYRYTLGDRVRVTGFAGATPSLEFIGREDRVSDRRGEKLNDAHVATVLRELLEPLDLGARFAMLAPDPGPDGIGYTLYVEAESEPPADLASRVDSALAENPHYGYCRALGQLAPLRLFVVDADARKIYLHAGVDRGGRLGEIKEAALSVESGWSGRFSGGYVTGPPVAGRTS